MAAFSGQVLVTSVDSLCNPGRKKPYSPFHAFSLPADVSQQKHVFRANFSPAKILAQEAQPDASVRPH